MLNRTAIIIFLGSVADASAQSAPPIGLWDGQYSDDWLLLQADGSCSVSGASNAAGTCSWNPTTTGGVLTMTYQWTTGPANIYWSVRWLDANTILLNEVEPYVRTQ